MKGLVYWYSHPILTKLREKMNIQVIHTIYIKIILYQVKKIKMNYLFEIIQLHQRCNGMHQMTLKHNAFFLFDSLTRCINTQKDTLIQNS